MIVLINSVGVSFWYAHFNFIVMEAILKFNLDEEACDFETAVRASDLKWILWDLDQKFRSMYKYEDKEWAYDARETLRQIMNEYDISFENKIFI